MAMVEKMQYRRFMAVSLKVVVFIGVCVVFFTACCKKPLINDKTYFETKRDTIFLAGESKIYYRTDTIIQTRPFTAYFDTVYHHKFTIDKVERSKEFAVSSSFTFPENMMTINVTASPDTMLTRQATLQKEASIFSYWVEILGLMLIAVFIGFYLTLKFKGK